MTRKEKLELMKGDFRESFGRESFDNSLKNLGEIFMAFPGIVVGAVEYAPFGFAMPIYFRRAIDKTNKRFVDHPEGDGASFYRGGKVMGGVLSNLAIHGSLVAHYIFVEPDKFDTYFPMHLGFLLLGNVISHGYEYWRGLGKRVEERGDDGVSSEDL